MNANTILLFARQIVAAEARHAAACSESAEVSKAVTGFTPDNVRALIAVAEKCTSEHGYITGLRDAVELLGITESVNVEIERLSHEIRHSA